MALKPEVSLTIAAATAAVVYGIFQVEVGSSLADVRNANPHNSIIGGTVNTAGWTSEAGIAGVSPPSKAPIFFVLRAAIAPGLPWDLTHGKVGSPRSSAGFIPSHHSDPLST